MKALKFKRKKLIKICRNYLRGQPAKGIYWVLFPNVDPGLFLYFRFANREINFSNRTAVNQKIFLSIESSSNFYQYIPSLKS